MEINGTNPLIILNNNVKRIEYPSPAEPVRSYSGQTSKDDGATSGSDRLEFSVRSREISHLDDLVKSISDIREDRVDQVRRELESGTYNVKAEKIAEKIIGGNLLDEVF